MPSSCLQFSCGLLALTIAIVTGLVIHLSAIPSDIHIHLDTSTPKPNLPLGKSTVTLTPQQLQDYHRDGFVFVQGLLSEQEAAQLKESAIYASSRLFDVFALFGKSRYKTIMFDLWRTSSDIASLSLQALPHVAAQLMIHSDYNDNTETSRPHTETIRLLRDAFFAYQPPGEACGWHVDDAGFWPAVEDTTGPTFWIALDPLLVSEGGGLAVLNRTLFAEAEPPRWNLTCVRAMLLYGTDSPFIVEWRGPSSFPKMPSNNDIPYGTCRRAVAQWERCMRPSHKWPLLIHPIIHKCGPSSWIRK
jgi:hypothetical protein